VSLDVETTSASRYARWRSLLDELGCRRVQGQGGTGLSDRGHSQATDVARHLLATYPRPAMVFSSDLERVTQRFVEVCEGRLRLLKRVTPGSYTFILPARRQVPRRATARKTIGVRIPGHPATHALLAELGEPPQDPGAVFPDLGHAGCGSFVVGDQSEETRLQVRQTQVKQLFDAVQQYRLLCDQRGIRPSMPNELEDLIDGPQEVAQDSIAYVPQRRKVFARRDVDAGAPQGRRPVP
jgi:hypothetical protein